MSNIDISFITPLYNCLDYTKAYLRTLEETANDFRYEIILIDDFSTDGTREYLKSLPNPPYRILLNEENRGFAHSANLGARVARGSILCMLNNDLVLQPNWLAPMLELLSGVPDVGAVGNIQRNPKTKLIDHAGVFFDLKGCPSHAWKTRKRRPSKDFSEWNAVTAACMVITAELFHSIGGFDEIYRNGFEDIDLCVRLRNAGYRILVSHRSEIEHHVSVSPERFKHERENVQIFLGKWQNITRHWGQNEWPIQYFHRYARYWWKMVPRRIALAIWMILRNSMFNRWSGNRLYIKSTKSIE